MEASAGEVTVRVEGARKVGLGEEMLSMTCDHCGATVFYSVKEKSLTCPYCDSNYVVETSAQEQVQPEGIIPFAITREQAAERFRAWLGNGFFRPGDLKERAKPERMRGVYLPYWAFTCDTESTWSASAGYTYKEKEHRVVKDPDGSEHLEEVEVEKVRWEPVSGTLRARYRDVLVPASKGLDSKLLSLIEPFRLEDLQPYQPEILAGWEAENYAVDQDEAWPKAKRKVDWRIKLDVEEMVPGDKHKDIAVSSVYNDVSARLLLLPLWISAYKYRGKVYRFMINGQTGEVQGEAPTSKAKLVAVIALVAAIVVALFVVL